jgi:hypothetical protein
MNTSHVARSVGAAESAGLDLAFVHDCREKGIDPDVCATARRLDANLS